MKFESTLFLDKTPTTSYDITPGMDEGCTAETTTDPKGNITLKVYDPLGRLARVTADSMTSAFTYYDNGSLQTVLYGDGSREDYTYTSDNLLQTLVNRKADSLIIDSYVYTYDAAHNLLTKTNSRRITSYTYDNNGNQLSNISTAYIAGIAQIPVTEQTNTYDLFNQLISTVTSTGVIVINTYNGDGRRVGKSVNGSLTWYLYEYDKVVLEANYLGDQTGRNVYGINLITRQVGADTFTYMYNGHADVTALLDTAGNVAATYYYDAFGNILDQTGTVNNNILYAGYQYDSETGLYYLNARMYDPVTARFMQEDTYAGDRNDPLSLNLYTYCHNEPLMYSDPTGHKDYRPGEGTADYYRKKYGGSNSTSYDRPQSTYPTLSAKAKAPIPTLSSVAKLTDAQVSFGLLCDSLVTSKGNGTQYYNRSFPAPTFDMFAASQKNNSNSYKNAFSLALGASVSVVNDLVVTPFVMITTENLKTLRHGGLHPDKQTQDINRLINSFYEVEGKEDSYFTDSGLINTAYYNKSKELGHYITLATCFTSGFIGDMGALSATAESDMMYAADGSIAFTDDTMVASKAGVVTESGTGALNPKDINFMQSSIKNQTGSNTVLDNIDALKNGTLKPEDLPTIKVWQNDVGKIWTLDHRRLASFKGAELESVPVQWATPQEVADQMWKMTTQNGGTSIKLKLGNGQSITIK